MSYFVFNTLVDIVIFCFQHFSNAVKTLKQAPLVLAVKSEFYNKAVQTEKILTLGFYAHFTYVAKMTFCMWYTETDSDSTQKFCFLSFVI